MESAKRERCPDCGSMEFINNICIREGEPINVFVQCSKCGSFVARYTVDCYTSNKRYESLLQFVSKRCFDSGRITSKRLKSFDEEIMEEFEHCKQLIKENEDRKRIEEIISKSEEEK